LMSLGHPGESVDTVKETRDWLLAVRPDDFDATVITPYPGSPYYDDATLDGLFWKCTCPNGDALYQTEVDYTAEADYYKGIPGQYVSHVWTEGLSRKALVMERDLLEDHVRAKLGIAYPGGAVKSLEQSMGQTR